MSNASGDDTPLTEREIQLTVLAVMDALDANVAFADADSEEFKRIIQKLQRNPASGQESRVEIIERVIRGGGTLKAAWKEIKRVESASGDDEELKEALNALQDADERLGRSLEAQRTNPDQNYGPTVRKGRRDADAARKALESLFGRIKEQRDRAHGDANEMAGHCMRLREEIASLKSLQLTPDEAELGIPRRMDTSIAKETRRPSGATR